MKVFLFLLIIVAWTTVESFSMIDMMRAFSHLTNPKQRQDCGGLGVTPQQQMLEGILDMFRDGQSLEAVNEAVEAARRKAILEEDTKNMESFFQDMLMLMSEKAGSDKFMKRLRQFLYTPLENH